MDYKIFSVESQKGGVGKTTIALNLAKALSEREYEVLLIDCDITGTSITEAASHSPFWRDMVDVVTVGDKPCNLMQYFEKVYLTGGINIEKDLISRISLEKDRFHLIGSEIYDKKEELIIDPRLLMDDLHSYWFVGLIQEIAEHFRKKVNTDKVAVILDNSPGYLGIGKSIREWLTSVGSDFAQFVLVSSLDEQDVDSTISTAVDIEKDMLGKWDVANKYDMVSKSGDDFKELNRILDKTPKLKDFYYSLKDKPYETKLKARPEAKDFISIVLNRVPVFYQDEHLTYNFKMGVSDDRDRIIKNLFPKDRDKLLLNMIYYDASISSQFIEANVSILETDESKRKAIDRAFNSFNQKRGKYVESQDKTKQAASLANSFGTLNAQLTKLGYRSLVESLEVDLTSDIFIQDMVAFVRGLGNVAIPQVEKLEIDREGIFKTDKGLLSHFITSFNLVDYSAALYSLFDTIYRKVGFNKGNVYNKFLVVNLSLLFKKFIEVQKRQCKNEGSYHMALMKGFNDKTIGGEILGYLTETKMVLNGPTTIVVDGAVMEMFRRYFVRFYQKMCYTLLRLIDCADDFGIVANAYQATIMRNGRILDGDLRQYVGAVVARKTVVFDKNRFNDLLAKPFEMQIVKDAIIRIVLNK